MSPDAMKRGEQEKIKAEILSRFGTKNDTGECQYIAPSRAEDRPGWGSGERTARENELRGTGGDGTINEKGKKDERQTKGGNLH